MRLLQVMVSSDAPEAFNKLFDKLRIDLGDPIVRNRRAIVPAEEDALEKLKRLHSV